MTYRAIGTREGLGSHSTLIQGVVRNKDVNCSDPYYLARPLWILNPEP